MLQDRCHSQGGARKLVANAGKAAFILCLFLSAIYYFGNLGFSKHSRKVRMQLRSVVGGGVSTDTDPSYANFDITTIFKDEEDGFPEFKRDPSLPYTLGPKISDWDEQRAEWLKDNPAFPSFLNVNKPRVLLVTGSSPKPCENPVGDHYLMRSLSNKIDYCRIHNIEIFYNMVLFDAEMSGFWAKLPLLRKLLLAHPDVEFIWWMDSDAMFTDMAFEVPWERYKDHNLVMHGWDFRVYDEKNWFGLNTGSFLLRNCQWSLDLLDALAPMGPKGKVRNEAGELLSKTLKHRPAFEADDQAAMVYILATEREKWGEKVYLESNYFLHGYWLLLVDRYEQMIEKYHPGFGDDRWPLVTHFVGCKPCAKVGDYSAERCFTQMDRAYNFADNQVLEMYGFTHKSLESRGVKRIRNETDKPLEFKDKYGLQHSVFRALNASFISKS